MAVHDWMSEETLKNLSIGAWLSKDLGWMLLCPAICWPAAAGTYGGLLHARRARRTIVPWAPLRRCMVRAGGDAHGSVGGVGRRTSGCWGVSKYRLQSSSCYCDASLEYESVLKSE